MNRAFLKSLLVVVATMFITERALAWANVGHAVIAHKAEELLTPEVKEKCYHYLRASLAYHASWMDQSLLLPLKRLLQNSFFQIHYTCHYQTIPDVC